MLAQSSALVAFDCVHGPDCACAEDGGMDHVADDSAAAGSGRALVVSYGSRAEMGYQRSSNGAIVSEDLTTTVLSYGAGSSYGGVV
jgi:hypothetical protein